MDIDLNKIYKQANEFNKFKVAVIGDFIVDKYVYGTLIGSSSSSEVPIIKEEKVIMSLGGASNVVNNLVNMGASVECFSVIGNDKSGKYILDFFKENKLDAKGIIIDQGSTNTKTRVLMNGKEVLRIDECNNKIIEKEMLLELDEWIKKTLCRVNAIVISDYNLGVCNEFTCKMLIEYANEVGITVIADSRSKDIKKFKGVSYIAPNIKEFNKILIENELDLIGGDIENAKKLIELYEIKEGIILTKGIDGILGIGKEENFIVKEYEVPVIDTVGAGDTVLAILSLGLNTDLTFRELIYLMNIGGAIAVSEKGTYALTIERLSIEILELLKKINYKNKIVDTNELVNITNFYKKLGKRIVFTNGCFDLVHSGHIDCLYSSKKLGDLLILGLNSDDSVKRLKGASRPINEEKERSISLAALEPVDYITIFNEDTPKELLEKIRPNILVKGGDYRKEELDGIEYVEEVVLTNYIEKVSTSNIIKKIIDRKHLEVRKDD